MVRKKTEGDEDQRRAAAYRARRLGEKPSAVHATTGASKQRTHVPHRHSSGHAERTAHIHEGKQRSGSAALARGEPRPVDPPGRTYRGRNRPGYTRDHEEVYAALADAQRANGGDAVHLETVAQYAGRPADETRVLLHDLTAVEHLASQLQGTDDPDLGPRYETRPGY